MKRIKEVIVNKGLTQTWLVEAIGKSHKMVNSYAQNLRQLIFRRYLKLREFLGTPSKYTGNSLKEVNGY